MVTLRAIKRETQIIEILKSRTDQTVTKIEITQTENQTLIETRTVGKTVKGKIENQTQVENLASQAVAVEEEKVEAEEKMSLL